MSYSFKQKLGAVIYDLPRFLWSMRPSSSHPWVLMRNRDERLIRTAHGQGVQCDWRWTSDLHIAKVFPLLGRALMNRALRDWPIEFQTEPLRRKEDVRVSFVIGHRGMERLPHLLLTLRSIAAQRDVAFECIVVEQSARPEAQPHLPSWVRYIHAQIPGESTPYNRAWAFNVGAREAHGEVLVLHDNDMLAPANYGREIIARLREGFEVINLKRFIFYLSEAHSNRVLSGAESILEWPPQTVVQNLDAGASVAIARDAYFAVGGFDESFVGWGGEDNEFWERARTRRVWPYSLLPMVHLWHPAQALKFDADNPNELRYRALSALPVDERIRALALSNFGGAGYPVGDRPAQHC